MPIIFWQISKPQGLGTPNDAFNQTNMKHSNSKPLATAKIWDQRALSVHCPSVLLVNLIPIRGWWDADYPHHTKLSNLYIFLFRRPCDVIATNAFTECLEFSRVANPSINGFLMHGHKSPTSALQIMKAHSTECYSH